ncbi:MAG: putative toxin-antitoxin system toxin component, PIN family [Bacteroidia bacterium]|nr:putative toxin-antitoxin system toxin component, PIN family [Bacteroidia bacterium]
MNIVFDTNVLVSAFVFGGLSGKALEYCIENDEIYISQWVISELSDVLRNKFQIEEAEVKNIVTIISAEFNLIAPFTPMPLICRDKDDNNILQLAESSNAHFIITGDKDLLVLEKFKQTGIIKPAGFLTIVKL